MECGLIKLRGKIMKRIPAGHIPEQACCDGKGGEMYGPARRSKFAHLKRSEVFCCILCSRGSGREPQAADRPGLSPVLLWNLR